VIDKLACPFESVKVVSLLPLSGIASILAPTTGFPVANSITVTETVTASPTRDGLGLVLKLISKIGAACTFVIGSSRTSETLIRRTANR
jgi:hypothetical protein